MPTPPDEKGGDLRVKCATKECHVLMAIHSQHSHCATCRKKLARKYPTHRLNLRVRHVG